MDRRRNSSRDAVPGKSHSPLPQTLTSFPSLPSPETAKAHKHAPATPDSSNSNHKKNNEANVNSPGPGLGPYLSMKHKLRASSGTKTRYLPNNWHNTNNNNDDSYNNGKPATGAVNRAVQAAANLRRSIMDSITSHNGTFPGSSSGIFSGQDDGFSDPLHGATEDQVVRIINSSGGQVATVKKYSADLAEANSRSTQERNSKLKLVEENRNLRAKILDKQDEIDEVTRQLTTAKHLFARYVKRMQHDLAVNPQVQILDSPAGPYALEDSSSTILAALKDTFVYPDGFHYSAPHTNESSTGQPLAVTPVNRGHSTDTIRPRNQARPAKLASLLVSAVKSDTIERVEMKSPVDMATLPPALRQSTIPSEALVDRLGFYITVDRQRRHQEASSLSSEDVSEASSTHSTSKDIEAEDDESLLSTIELLCDAPTTPSARLIFRSESNLRIFVEVDKAAGQTAKDGGFASLVNVTHVSGGLAPTTATSALNAMLQPIQDSRALSSLLIKLNQAYDVQQSRRTSAWVSFYGQTRHLLQKTTDEPLDENNVAGVMALCSASQVSPEIRQTLNNLIRCGIPVSFRREVWLERSGANNIRDPELYAALLASNHLEDDDGLALKEITVDVERTLSNNVFFREGPGKSHLRDVLVAFAVQNPSIGYSQGLNIIAANLLLMVPEPEDGFALLQVLVKEILPEDYYARDSSISGNTLERDGRVISSYLKEFFPVLHKHLLTRGARLSMFTPGWFISGFAACFNGEALYRLWDLVFGFCDGRFVFCFALALLKLNRKGLMACRDAKELMSYLGGRMSNAAVSLDVLINETFRMGEKITPADVARRRDKLLQDSATY